MTVVTLNRKELEKVIGKVDAKVEEKIIMFGTTVEESTSENLAIEVYPNRPDLLSLQGFARAMENYINEKKIKEYKVNKPVKNYKVIIEKEVKQVRPYSVCAIVKNLKLSDEKIKELIDIQEKLHMTLGRKRKKLAIGVYPLEKIKLPIRFTAKKPDEIKFIPLEADREMTGRQILRSLATGREYAHLLEDKEVYPVFLDANNKVLSMPPIINSHETGKIGLQTKDVFIECSGFNLFYLKKTLNILVCALEDMGGEVFAMEIEDEKEGRFVSPSLENEKMKFKIEDIEKTLGIKLDEKTVKKCLNKMGIEYSNGVALIPAYRTDILHWVDLAEEIGIAYGYENFESEIPEIATIASESFEAVLKRKVGEILAGLGLLECSTYHLTTKDNVRNMHYDFKDFIEVEESKTEYSVLRNDLMNQLMKILSENSDSSYPQRIFEAGRIFRLNSKEETGIEEKERVAVALASETSNFTEAKSALDYLCRMLGKEYKIEPTEDCNFISGRAGKILIDGREAGIIGEIAPRVLKNWKIKVPVCGFELGLSGLM